MRNHGRCSPRDRELGQPLRARANANRELLDARGEDLGDVDPDYAVPGYAEGQLSRKTKHQYQGKHLRRGGQGGKGRGGTYSVDINTNDGYPPRD